MFFCFILNVKSSYSHLESSTVYVQPFVHLWMAGDIYFLMLELKLSLFFSFTLGAFVSLFRFVHAF